MQMYFETTDPTIHHLCILSYFVEKLLFIPIFF